MCLFTEDFDCCWKEMRKIYQIRDTTGKLDCVVANNNAYVHSRQMKGSKM